MSKRQNDKNWADLRKAALVRDRERCMNCLVNSQDVVLDPDHTVPRGVGGSDRLSNITTLCRRCHKAKHGDGVAPTIELQSTGGMTDTEFYWFKQFLREMVPSMASTYEVRLIPKFGLNEKDQWYVPLGDLRRLDRQLAKAEIEYSPLEMSEFM